MPIAVLEKNGDLIIRRLASRDDTRNDIQVGAEEVADLIIGILEKSPSQVHKRVLAHLQ